MTQGLQLDSIEILCASISNSTMKQYEGSFQEWKLFCDQRSWNLFDTTPERVLEFLTMEFKLGASYASLNTAKSAISLISKQKIGDDPVLKRFFKGVYRLRPARPKYEFTWDVNIVLEEVEKWFPLASLSLEDLTYKTLILLALSTAHRAQTFSLINIDEIKETKVGLEIRVSDFIKTSKAGRCQPLLMLPFFHDNPGLCVANTIKAYIERTRSLRGQERSLFIAVKKPFKGVSAQTISRWLKLTLQRCGVDTSIFSAHSTRHASSSAALIRGISIDLIQKTAGWSNKSKVFSRFYNRQVISKEEMYANMLLLKRNEN